MYRSRDISGFGRRSQEAQCPGTTLPRPARTSNPTFNTLEAAIPAAPALGQLLSPERLIAPVSKPGSGVAQDLLKSRPIEMVSAYFGQDDVRITNKIRTRSAKPS